jgi:thiol-disulfide isomerase/thioredoxin
MIPPSRAVKRLVMPLGLVLAAAIAAVLLVGLKDRAGGPELVGQVNAFALDRRAGHDVAWRDADDNPVALADFRGKVVMVNYWATWCAPCIRELPSIDRLQAALADEEFAVVAINVDRGGKQVAGPFAEKLGLANLALYVDPRNATGRAVGVSVMPTTIIYDRRGNEVGRMEGGAEWDAPEAVALMRWFIDRDA